MVTALKCLHGTTLIGTTVKVAWQRAAVATHADHVELGRFLKREDAPHGVLACRVRAVRGAARRSTGGAATRARTPTSGRGPSSGWQPSHPQEGGAKTACGTSTLALGNTNETVAMPPTYARCPPWRPWTRRGSCCGSSWPPSVRRTPNCATATPTRGAARRCGWLRR